MSFATLGMFIIDEFEFFNEDGQPIPHSSVPSQIGGGGTYAVIGARIWLSDGIGMLIDRGTDWQRNIQEKLDAFGPIWIYRDQLEHKTTRAVNRYLGEHRNFEYLTPRIRITPRDLQGTRLGSSEIIHFICSPSRASTIMSQVREVPDWAPTTIYEPIPDRCVPEELPALQKVLPEIDILSPNAEESFSVLSMPLPLSRQGIEEACRRFLQLGVGREGTGAVVIRSGAMGACVALRGQRLRWVDAFWTSADETKIVDVTGAGNSFLGGLAAGLKLSGGDIYQATLYASVSASFIIEQTGLPSLSSMGEWNHDSPQRRLDELRARVNENV
ncbi:PfkB domain-containing protein [Mycena kentingensis (nom. inval.)]|nr:PfkB domain-containing protein [Mycena kentingensis (nom. inval.)]